MRQIIPVLALACACASPTPGPKDPGHDRPLSVFEHEQEAQRHEREAAVHQAQQDPEATRPAASTQCYDNPLAPDPTSGGETMRVMRPCWTAVTSADAEHRRYAAINLQAARRHRDTAAALLGAEKRACAGLGEAEISRTPFSYREDIAGVEAYYEGKHLRGARVLFRPVKGLTADWMRRATHCHQARAAVMGYSATFMSYCPLMVGELGVAVEETRQGILVTLRATDDAVAAAVLGRARALVSDE